MAGKRTARHLNRFLSMETDELGLFLRAWMTMAGWWLRIRFSRIPDGLTAGPAADPDGVHDQRDLDFIRQCQLATQRAENYHFLRGHCLLRALTLQSLLVTRDLNSRLRIGVRGESANAMNAHAWLEVGDRSIGRLVPGEAPYRSLDRKG